MAGSKYGYHPDRAEPDSLSTEDAERRHDMGEEAWKEEQEMREYNSKQDEADGRMP